MSIVDEVEVKEQGPSFIPSAIAAAAGGASTGQPKDTGWLGKVKESTASEV